MGEGSGVEALGKNKKMNLHYKWQQTSEILISQPRAIVTKNTSINA